MSSRKVEERNEKIIRGLMKLPPNRRCINCNSLGPQYVCTNFRTFVCVPCSGIHREFTHRVKSVSMSKFTSQEVEALQKGGNQFLQEGTLSHATTKKSTNPFYIPYDSDLESSNMFLDMSSLQAVFPNGQKPTSFTGGVTEPWFTENPIVPFIPAGSLGALGLLGGPSPNTQLTSVQSQGPVAPIGGNPFA